MFSSVCNIREKRRDVLQITIYMLGKFRVLFCYGKYLLTCLRVLIIFDLRSSYSHLFLMKSLIE